MLIACTNKQMLFLSTSMLQLASRTFPVLTRRDSNCLRITLVIRLVNRFMYG